MAGVSAKAVSELRAQTGAGLMDCKRALEESEGDFQRAIEILRVRGQIIAGKKAGREANEGVIHAHLSEDSSFGILVELNCETDFVARTEDFQGLARKIAVALAKSRFSGSREIVEDTERLLSLPFEEGTTVGNLITDAVGRIGENIRLSRAGFMQVGLSNGFISSYIHLDGKIGVLVAVETANEAKRNDVNVSELARNLCLQIAATDPIAIERGQVPADVLDRELRIAKEQTLAEGKPQNLVDKIAEGRLNKFFKESVLLEQEYVKDEKRSVKQVVEEVSKKVGCPVRITEFIRFQVGGE